MFQLCLLGYKEFLAALLQPSVRVWRVIDHSEMRETAMFHPRGAQSSGVHVPNWSCVGGARHCAPRRRQRPLCFELATLTSDTGMFGTSHVDVRDRFVWNMPRWRQRPVSLEHATLTLETGMFGTRLVDVRDRYVWNTPRWRQRPVCLELATLTFETGMFRTRHVDVRDRDVWNTPRWCQRPGCLATNYIFIDRNSFMRPHRSIADSKSPCKGRILYFYKGILPLLGGGAA